MAYKHMKIHTLELVSLDVQFNNNFGLIQQMTDVKRIAQDPKSEIIVLKNVSLNAHLILNHMQI